MHHPFTAPIEEDKEKLNGLIERMQAIMKEETEKKGKKNEEVEFPFDLLLSLSSIRGAHYDYVMNGVELGGGSIRIHSSSLQSSVFQLLNASPSSFQHLLTALQYGAPPHGGFALGMDRFIASLAANWMSSSSSSPSSSTPSSSYVYPLPIREVIAFPKTATGKDLLIESPARVEDTILKQYHIQVQTQPQ